MSAPDDTGDTAGDAPGPLKRRDGEPVFDEPWQAQVLAMADALVKAGAIAAADWSETLGAELRRLEAAGEPDDAGTYYRAALAALEGLLDRTGAIPVAAVDERRDAWARAYAATPHGKPVSLDRD